MDRKNAVVDAGTAFFKGDVFHARFRPHRHEFRYPVFFLRLNVRKLSGSTSTAWFGFDCWRPLAFFQADHGHRDGSDILAWAQALIKSAGVSDPGGNVFLYTFPRVWGFAFKPVSFWHWLDAQGKCRLLLVEVNNTFGERHVYLLQAADGGEISETSVLGCAKCFYVSPFCEVKGQYRFTPVAAETRYRMVIDYADGSGDLLHTSLAGRALPFTAGNAVRLLLGHPLLTFGIVFRIHWQALRLWLKGVPLFRKPTTPTAEVRS